MGINTKAAVLALVIIAFIILIGLGSSSEMDRASVGGAGSSIDQYTHSTLPQKPTLDDNYKDNMDMELDCKKASKDLQEFYDCMDNPWYFFLLVNYACKSMGINKKGAALALVIIAFMILIGLGGS